MLHKLRQRTRDEQGFTLIELLVVILIIGILAAIALPAFLGQRSKGQDSSAKSDARNAVSQMESCFVDSQSYDGCTLADSGLPVGPGAGQVSVTVGTPVTQKYTIVARSKSGNTFTIAHDAASGDTRTCTITGGTPKGGCQTGLTW